MKPKKPPFRNNPDWIRAWTAYLSGQTKPLTDRQIAAHGGIPSCARCWDTGLCRECLGRYPQYCDCNQGNCDCPAGTARQHAYNQSLKDYGLA